MSQNRRNRVVVALTSYPLRIGNCTKVVSSALDSTLRPDIVFLSLSEAEFPGRENDLPSDLVELAQRNPEFRINWVPGENTKTMKKVFPVLKYLDDDDVIMTLDDDRLLHRRLLQSRYEDFERIGRSAAVTARSDVMCSNNMFTKGMMHGFDLFWTDDIIRTYHDDQYYTKVLYLNGYKFVCGSEFPLNQTESYNPINGLTQNHGYLPGLQFHEMFKRYAEGLFGLKWHQLFGIFRKIDIEGYRNKVRRSETCPL